MSDKLEKMTKALAAQSKLSHGEIVPKARDNMNLSNDAEEDYNIARDNLKNLLNKSDEALDHMMQVAAEAEHPRAFEVLSNHIRNVGEVTDKLMKLQKAKKDLTKEDRKQVTNNNVFVGSTTDLQRMLLNKDDNIIDVEPDKEQ